MVNYLDFEVTKWFALAICACGSLLYIMEPQGMTILIKKGKAAGEQEKDRGKERERSLGEGNVQSE